MSSSRTTLFVSYSRKDGKYVEALKIHLAPLAKKLGLEVWDDSRQPIGQRWEPALLAALERARVAVLLISPDFLASKFVNDVELPRILHYAEKDGLVPCVVHIRPSSIQHVQELASIQAVNDPSKPIAMLGGSAREAAWVEIATKIGDCVARVDGTERDHELGLATLDEVFVRLKAFFVGVINLHAAFDCVGELAFHSEDDFRELSDAVLKYNELFEDLQTRQHMYVRSMTPHLSEALVRELRELFQDLDSELNAGHIFRLNDVRVRIHQLQRNQVAPHEIEAFREHTRGDLRARLRTLDARLRTYRMRAERLYNQALEHLQ